MAETCPARQLTTSALPVHIAVLLQKGTDTNTNWASAFPLWQQHTATSTPNPFYASLPLFLKWIFLMSLSPSSVFFSSSLPFSPFHPHVHHRWVLNNPAAAVALHMLALPPSCRSLMFVCSLHTSCTCPEIPEKWTKFLSSCDTKFLGEQGMWWYPCSGLNPEGGVSSISSGVLSLPSSSGNRDLAPAFFQVPNLCHKAPCGWEETIFHITAEPAHWN